MEKQKQKHMNKIYNKKINITLKISKTYYF